MTSTGWVVLGVGVLGLGALALYSFHSRQINPATAAPGAGQPAAPKQTGVSGVVQKLDDFGHNAVCGVVAKAYGAGSFSNLCPLSAAFDPAHYASNVLETGINDVKSGNYSGAVVQLAESPYTIAKSTVTGAYNALKGIF